MTPSTAAREFAARAHRGQVDKIGRPYIEHPARVAARIRTSAPDEPDAEVVAWLHDVVEDTPVTIAEIKRRFGARVAAAVDAITYRPDEDRAEYFRRVAGDPLALLVKHADIDDNTDPSRTALLDEATRRRLAEKYQHARQVLAAPASAGRV
jgi:(p)ppGpp synthase/HD superfamily hydrolase